MSEARTVSAAFAAPQPVGWTDIERASGSGATAEISFNPVLSAIDARGRALAVWFQRNPVSAPHRLMANLYTPGVGWGTAVDVAPAVADRAYESPVLAMDPSSGRAMLVWMQRDGTANGTNRSVWSRAFDPASGWGAIEAIQSFNPTAISGELHVGIDASGRATAVWSHDPDGPASQTVSIYANRHVPGSGWGTPARIGGDTTAIFQTRVVVTPNGTAVALWGGLGSSLWSSQSSDGGAWSSPAELVKAERLRRGAFLYDVAMNANGEGLLAWRDFQSDGRIDTYAIKAKRFLQGAWQTPDLLVEEVSAAEDQLRPKVAISAQGHSVIAWQPRDESLRAAVGLSGQAWSVSVVKPADGLTLVDSEFRLQVGIDALGNAMVAWTQRTNATNPDLYINRYTPAGGWGGPSLHENLTGVAEWPTSPALAMNDRGQAMLAWHQGFHLNPSGTEVDFRIVSRFYSSGR